MATALQNLSIISYFTYILFVFVDKIIAVISPLKELCYIIIFDLASI